MSIHLSATPADLAETILLPGDPLRAEAIANEYLEEVVCYNKVRGMLGFTGFYKGQRVSVQGTGMGLPSTSIYVNELIELGARRLIRVGTCGSFQGELEIGDVVLAMSASTDSSMNQHVFEQKDYAPTATFSLLMKAYQHAKELGLTTRVGNILSSDTFYQQDPDHWKIWAEYGVLGVEMESSALYTLAAKHKIEALSILTVSDSLVTGQLASSEERQSNFQHMAEMGLHLI
jgi:purine-nucleoside phosphorylase